jgi:hypothetical protein
MERVDPEGRDSGWFFGCDDTEHDHGDPSALRRDSLYSIGSLAPGTIQFLGLPPGVTVSFGGPGRIEVERDSAKLTIEPGSFLDRLRSVGGIAQDTE